MKCKLINFAKSIGIDEIGIAPIRVYEEFKGAFRTDTPFCAHYSERERTDPFWAMEGANSVIVYLIPYNCYDIQSTIHADTMNISMYAWGRDYHDVAEEIGEKMNAYLESEIEGYHGKAYCDITPLPQRHLAYLAGLGFFGKNHTLISPKYGSYVFIAHIICNYKFEPDIPLKQECSGCNKCIEACPNNVFSDGDFNRCVSAITQKRNIGTEFEKCAFSDTVWGCDVCQTVCPHNEGVQKSPLIDYFGESVSAINQENAGMKNRPFSYKGETFMKRNLQLYRKINE